MMNLFSVFDPTSYFGISFNWVVIILIFCFFPLDYFLVKSASYSSIMIFVNSVKNMFMEVAGPNYMGVGYLVVGVFLYLVVSNLMGLFPFVFTATAHPMITMGMGLVMWLSFFMMGWMKNFKISIAHLVPEGSPLVLAPLMVIIESISHLMRPFTLSIRLAANMMAGHLIISLLASISSLSFFGFFMSFFFQSLLLVLELGVSVIQGFVFSILLLLYALEYY